MLILVSAAKAQQVFVDTYTYTGGSQTFTVPSCVSTITLEAWGAQGGTNAAATVTGGLGGYATGILNVNQGDVLYIYVGGQDGFNGGGLGGITLASGSSPSCATAGGGNGGGGSDIRLNNNTLAGRVIVAGGGGGAGGDRIPACGRGSGGGGGGGYYGGGGGGAGWTGAAPGGTLASGGSQTSGGSQGTSVSAYGSTGFPGSLGQGGNGGNEQASNQGTPTQTSMPGGGGGLVGGPGDQISPSSTYPWAGQSGAGGSSYLGSLIAASTTSAVRSGNGQIKLKYSYLGAGVSIVPSATSICMGQNVSLTASGVLSYTWFPVGTLAGSNSTNVNDVPASTTSYTVQGTNSIGCVSESVVTIYVGGNSINVSVSNPAICEGQSSTLTASGASSYNWSNQGGGFSIVTSGSLVVNTNVMSGGGFDVIGTDSLGCNSPVASVTVTVLSPATAISGPSTICKGSIYTLSASGADTYTWNTGSNTPTISVSPNTNTVYTVVGAQSQGSVSCYSSASLAITANNSPGVGAISNHNIVCSGESIVLTAIGADSYTWTNGSTTHVGGVWQVNPTSSQASTQVYTVTGSNQYDCTDTFTIGITVNPCTGIVENKENAKISIYPNPNNGEFLISTTQQMELQLINEIGQVVKTIKIDEKNTQVKFNNLNSGIYFIIGKGEQGIMKEKIIIDK